MTLPLQVVPSNLNTKISPNDMMYASPAEQHDALDRYLMWGRSAGKAIRIAMAAGGVEDIQRILDLPCGHGRVLRTLRAMFPAAAITACDIDREAVDFCAETFSATPAYSTASPNEIEIEGRFDLIWCGSLLTHLDAPAWSSFLAIFSSLLNHRGILVFSTHGRRVAERFRSGVTKFGVDASILDDYDATGFGYRNYPRGLVPAPIGTDEDIHYGISLSNPAWVCHEVTHDPLLHLLLFLEHGWNGHHDLIACQKLTV
jgi:SAM-dependent methyltransferase